MDGNFNSLAGGTSYARRRRWWTLVVLELGGVMIIIDMTIINVALASIKTDLGFSDAGLVWVVDGYMIPFAGLILFSGRLSDLFGHRRLFLIGVGLFTLASLACGAAWSQGVLIVGRALQGVSGAIVSATIFSLTMNLFTDTDERAKAIGISGIITASGGSVGLLLGGLLTSALNWHWIFLINVPLGAGIYALGVQLVPRSKDPLNTRRDSLDIAGAITVTSALMLATYAILADGDIPGLSNHALGLLVCAALLLFCFLTIEAHVSAPLLPLRLFRHRNLTVSSAALALLCSASGTWYFVTSLYLRLVLHASPLVTALTFLPANVISAGFALTSSALVLRLGIKVSLVIGCSLEIAGLLLLAFTPAQGDLTTHVLPSIFLLGLGGNLAFIPLLLSAMADIPTSDSGVASGIINTVFTMGQTLGLALILSVANVRTMQLLSKGNELGVSLTGGYHVAYFAGAILAALTGACGFLLTPRSSNLSAAS
jgi:EmrB/QacA subfamily drug resistance transporter